MKYIKEEPQPNVVDELEVQSQLQKGAEHDYWEEDEEDCDSDVDLTGEFLDMYLEFPEIVVDVGDSTEARVGEASMPLGATVPLSEGYDLVPTAGTIVPVPIVVPRLVTASA